MKLRVHAAAGATALLVISFFWISTIAVEIFGSQNQIVLVKHLVLYGMGVLIPALVVTGITGNLLAKGWKNKVVQTKNMRMKIAAANGLLVLLPSAIFLAMRSSSGNFDYWFISVQGLEIVAGLANITLLALNASAGLQLRRRRAY